MAVYNGGKFLSEQIDSILAQSAGSGICIYVMTAPLTALSVLHWSMPKDIPI